MFRLSRWLALGGSLLIAAGALLLLGLVLLPGQTPALQVTPDLSHIITPTFAYLGTPLQPPSASNAGAVLILPEMPVAASATPAPSDTATATPTETATVSPTVTESPSPAPTSPTATLPVAVTSPGATRPAPTASPTHSATASASPTDTPTPTATPSPTNSATPTATLTATNTLTPTSTLTPPPSAPERIIIPAIAVDAPVEPVGWHSIEVDGQLYGQWDVPQGYAAGWHNTSAPPGQPGNTVLNGHHNVNGRVFGALIDLQPGDDITLLAGGRSFAYVVVQSMVLQERYVSLEERLANAQWILPSSDERLTLVSCWPENDNSHRLIVVALPRSALPPGVFDDLLSGP